MGNRLKPKAKKQKTALQGMRQNRVPGGFSARSLATEPLRLAFDSFSTGALYQICSRAVRGDNKYHLTKWTHLL